MCCILENLFLYINYLDFETVKVQIPFMLDFHRKICQNNSAVYTPRLNKNTINSWSSCIFQDKYDCF